ncbi:hypothetical protein [Alkalihalobacillus sp. 1P02AB]
MPGDPVAIRGAPDSPAERVGHGAGGVNQLKRTTVLHWLPLIAFDYS